MGANHNGLSPVYPETEVVSNVPKILKWEQITTLPVMLKEPLSLFPMFQRY